MFQTSVRKLSVFLVLQLLILSLFAQLEQHTKWKFSSKETAPGEFEVIFSCSIDPSWHLYSQHLDEGGPVPTTFHYQADKKITIKGKPEERGKAIKHFDDIFAMDVIWFEGKVDFVQKVKAEPGSVLKGNIELMTCSDVDGKCVLDDVSFSIPLLGKDAPIDTQAVPIVSPLDTAVDDSTGAVIPVRTDKFDWSHAESNVCATPKKDVKGNWMIFLLGFGGGLLALLTPCVFPMIPLTVSFFTKGGKETGKGIGRAVTYGLSIIIIYVALGILITSIFGADALNAMSTNIWFNLLFFFVFVIFAFSFFGFYEITLPHKWATATDEMADKGGTIGIFFMAFTLSLVSFSCTGPIIGTLLVEAATGGGSEILGRIPVKPLLGMFGFSLALALPFTLFALFPNWLKSLPQSGGWMNTVKVVLGFLELALALKFLSVVDMTQNWGVLRIEIFLAAWIIIFLSLAAYAFGLIRFPHDEKGQKVTVARAILAGIALLFSGYLATGYDYQPLKLLSGLAPPTHYNFKEKVKKSDDCPAGLDCFKDYDQALAYAKSVNKPLLIDFTGFGCVNCRKMEENVWTIPEINTLMKQYVLVSLYVDDRKALPDSAQYTSNATGKERVVRTVGNKWSDFQARHFRINSQPYYVLLSPNEEILSQPVGYMPNADEYKKYLQCGLSTFAVADR